MVNNISDDLKKILGSIKVGDRIFDRYIVKSNGIIGGESIIYKVKFFDTSMERALKIIPFYKDGKNSMEQLLKQINIWEQFSNSNQNILPIHTVETDTICDVGVICFLMEYSDVGSLSDFIDSREYAISLEPENFFSIARGMLHGFLDSVEQNQQFGSSAKQLVFHGDIKPQNVIIFRDGYKFVPKIIDFGISVTAHDMIGGYSIPYASLEILTGQSKTPSIESELWALGASYYEFLYGRVPFPIANSFGSNSDTAYAVSAEIETSELNFNNPRYDLEGSLLSKFVSLLRELLDLNPDNRKNVSISHIEFVLTELENEAREKTQLEKTRSFIGRDTYLWHPSVHKLFDEKEYFLIIRNKSFSLQSAAEIHKILQEQRVHGYSMHVVFGPYDHLVRLWTKRDFNAIQELAKHFGERSVQAIMCTGKSRSLKGQNKEIKNPAKTDDLKHTIKRLVENEDYAGLKRRNLVLGKINQAVKEIRAFTFIEMSAQQSRSWEALFTTLYDMFNTSHVSDLLKKGQIYGVEGYDGEANTKIVIEYTVKQYHQVYDVLEKIIEKCNDLNFECGYKTFMEVKPLSGRVCDDGEFLAEIMHGR